MNSNAQIPSSSSKLAQALERYAEMFSYLFKTAQMQFDTSWLNAQTHSAKLPLKK